MGAILRGWFIEEAQAAGAVRRLKEGGIREAQIGESHNQGAGITYWRKNMWIGGGMGMALGLFGGELGTLLVRDLASWGARMGEGLRVPLLVGLGAGMIGSGLGVWANKSVSLQMARDEEREGQGGKTTVKVRTEDRQREEARKILMRAGAIEVEEEGLS